jgi:hypothetical protein
LENDLKWKKSLWVVFFAVGPALHQTQPIFTREPTRLPFPTSQSLADGVHLSGQSSPNPSLCSTPACHRRPISRRRAGHTLIAFTTSLSTCRREPSHLLLVPWSITSSLAAALLPPVAAPARMPPPAARRRSLAPPAPLAELTRP